MKKVKISDELKDVFKESIVIYQYAIDYDTEGMTDKQYYNFLRGEYLEKGICWLSKEVFEISIYSEMKEIGDKLGFEISWFRFPEKHYSIKKNKKLLKKRLKIMIKLLK